MLSENSGVVTTMPVVPSYGSDNGFGGFGNDWGWIILLLLFAGGGWGNGFGMGGYGGYEFPWLFNGQNNINANTNNGFQNAMINDNISSIRDGVASLSTQMCDGFGNVSNQLCGGFAGVNAAINNAQNSLAQQMNTNQMANLERSFAAQTANTQALNGVAMNLQNCCCENRSNIADLKYTVATENCADRAAVSDGIRDVLANNTANSQAVLNALNSGVQSIKDQLCSDKIEQKNDIIAQLRSELMYARGQASQDVQTAAIQAGQRALTNEIEQMVVPRPIPSYTVASPYCCNQAATCGCGM